MHNCNQPITAPFWKQGKGGGIYRLPSPSHHLRKSRQSSIAAVQVIASSPVTGPVAGAFIAVPLVIFPVLVVASPLRVPPPRMAIVMAMMIWAHPNWASVTVPDDVVPLVAVTRLDDNDFQPGFEENFCRPRWSSGCHGQEDCGHQGNKSLLCDRHRLLLTVCPLSWLINA